MKLERFVASVILLASFIAAFASSTALAQSGTLQFSSATYSVNESGPFVAVSITRVGGTTGMISTTFTTSDGTAVAPSDYQAQNITVTFLDGATGPSMIAIPIVDDTAGEGDETFNVQLSGGPLGTPTQATVTIVDNEGPTGVLQFSSPTFSINENGVGFVDVTVDRVGGSGGTISALLTTSDGMATAPADYQAQSITLTFLGGAVGPAHIAIPIVNDTLGEGDETFNVQLTGPLVGTPAQATVTIVDDEGPPGVLQFSSPTFSVNENGAGFVDVTVDRVGGSGGTISVQLTTSDGTATAPADYQAQSLTLTFLNGALGPAHIAIPIVNDAAAEGNETFNVQLSGASAGSPSQAVVTIVDDDAAAVAVQPVPTLSTLGLLALAFVLLVAVYLEMGSGKKRRRLRPSYFSSRK